MVFLGATYGGQRGGTMWLKNQGTDSLCSAASQTLKATMQKGIRNAVHPIVRRYATKQCQLRYNQLGSQHGRFYTGTFFSSCKSSRGHTMAQLSVNDI